MGICEELEILEMKESKRIVPMTVALPAALDSDSPPLMTGVRHDGSRITYDGNHAQYHEVQTLIYRNRSVTIGSTVSASASTSTASASASASSSSDSMTGVLDNDCDVYGLDIAGSERKIYELQYIHSARNSWRGYLIRDCVNGRDLLKVKHLTKSGIRRRKRRDTKNKNGEWKHGDNVWLVENCGLYANLLNGTIIGMIEDKSSDNQVFTPYAKSLPGVPVLMMKAAAKLGQHYWLTVAETGNSVGDVSNGRMARMHENSKIYTANVHNLTAEEAVLWLTLICATDMKRSIIPQKTTRHSKTISLFHPK